MEKGSSGAINLLFEPINERLKGPFTGAFFISWLIVNWKALIFIASYDYEKEVFDLFKVLENCYFSIWKVFTYPFLLAVSYIIVSPLSASIAEIIKVLVRKNIRDRFTMKIYHSEPISHELYKGAVEELDKLRSSYSKLDAEKTQIEHQKMNYETENRTLQTTNKVLEKANAESMVREFYSFLSGTWELEWKDKKSQKGGREQAVFNEDDRTYYYSPIGEQRFEPAFRLEGIFINKSNNELCFTKIDITPKKEFNHIKRVLFNKLTIDETGRHLVGDENEDYSSIVLKKISDKPASLNRTN